MSMPAETFEEACARRRAKLDPVFDAILAGTLTMPEWALKDWERITGKPYDPPPPPAPGPSEEWKAKDAEWRMARDAERMAQEEDEDSNIIDDWEDEGPGEVDEEAPLSFDLKSILERLEAVVAAHAARTDDAAAFTEAAKKDLLLLKKHRKLEFLRMKKRLKDASCDMPGLLKALKAMGMKADNASRKGSKLSGLHLL